PSKLVMTVYETFCWDKGIFQLAPSQRYIYFKENRIALIKHLENELQIKDLSEWYQVSLSQVIKASNYVGGLQLYPLEQILPEVYPNHSWNTLLLQHKGKRIKASQRWLKL